MLGSLYIYSLWKEKEYQRAFEEAFAVPAPSKDVNWIVNKDVVRNWAVYVMDMQNYSSATVAMKGTEWVYTRFVSNEDTYLRRSDFFSSPTTKWFEDNNWVGSKNTLINGRRYDVAVSLPMGVGNYTFGYLRVWNNKIRVVYLGMQTDDKAYETSTPPYSEDTLNYPFGVEYRVFISDVVSVDNIIKGLNQSSSDEI